VLGTRIRPGSLQPPVSERRDNATAGDETGEQPVVILYWPRCGHGLEDDEVLYDRPVCIVCEAC
jgi:hypothetical protein